MPPSAPNAAEADWRLVALLGRGGSSEVWHAVDRQGHSFALKRWRSGLESRPGARAWLEREHGLLVRLRHPSIVRTHGVVELAGVPVLALEYLGGGDLVSLAGGPAQRWLGAARAICTAVCHVHAHGLVHGDLKARNVLFDGEQRARLVDFAAALPIGARRAGQRRAAPSDDCQAFAALALELVTGRWPGLGRHVVVPRAASGRDSLGELARLAAAALAAEGRLAQGLLAFQDVIESAIAADSLA